MKRVGVLGSGDVGQTLASGFKTHGYEVRIGSRTPQKLADFAKASGIAAGTFAEVAAWGDTLVLAVAGAGAEGLVRTLEPASLRGKLVIDTTNPIKSDAKPVDGVLQMFTGPNESLLERLQTACLEARFVKAFSCVGNAKMVNPRFKAGPPTMFFCGNDTAARAEVAGLLKQFGWEPADMGKALAARAIEPLAMLWCIPGFLQNSWSHAFRVLWS